MSSTAVNGPIDPAAALAGRPLAASTLPLPTLASTLLLDSGRPAGSGRHIDGRRPVLRRERQQPGRRVDHTRQPDGQRFLQ